MGEKLKNIYLKIFSDKRALLFSFGLVLFLGLIPLSAAHANSIWDGLIAIGTVFSEKLVQGSLGIIANLLGLIFSGTASLLSWTIKNIMSIPVSPNSQGIVPIVKEGWELSRDIVNIFFILILAFIGLATVLRLQSYQIKKTLPSLIIIALLVNFSGVLVGFVVDIGNILTNFFLTATIGTVWSSLGFPGAQDGSDLLALVSYYVAQSFYYFIAILIYWIILCVFFIRVFVLWILSIVAPLAFGLYVLPSTRKFWSQWLSTLIQWSIVGIPISFFLYLSGRALTLFNGSNPINPDPLNPNPLAAFMGPFVAIFLLFAGVALSMQMAPAGARGAINFGKKTGIGAMGRAGRRAWQATRDRIPEETRKSMERMAIKENPAWGKGKKGLGGFFQKQAAGVAGYARRTTGGIAKSAVVGGEQADADKAKAKASKQDVISNMKDLRQASSVAQKTAIMDAMRQKNQIKDALNPDIVGKDNLLKQYEVESIYEKAHKTRNDDLVEGLERAFLGEEWKDEKGNTFYTNVQETEKDENGNIKKDASGNIIYKTDGNGNPVYKKRMFSDMFAEITNEMTKNAYDVNDRTGLPAGTYTGGDGKEVVISKNRASGLNRKDIEEKGYASFAEKVVAEAKTADEIKALQKGWWNNEDLMNAAHKFWGGSQTGQAATAFGRDFINKLEMTKKHSDWYFELEEKKDSKGNISYAPRNTAMVRYEASSAAQGLGISPKEGGEITKDVNDKTKNALKNARTKSSQPPSTPSATSAVPVQTETETEEIKELKKEIEELEKQKARLEEQKTKFPNIPHERAAEREKNLRELEIKIEEKRREIETMERERELLTPPPPLPKTQRGMQGDMKKLIRSGEKYTSEINTQINRYKALIESEKDLEAHLISLRNAVREYSLEISRLNEKEKTIGLTNEEISSRDSHSNEASNMNEQIAETKKFIELQKEKIESTKKAIADLKTNLESEIRKPLEPMEENWESSEREKNEEKIRKSTYKNLKKGLK